MKEMRKIKIEIPILPNRVLGPNASRYQHWGVKASAKKKLQEATYWACTQALMQRRWEGKPEWKPLEAATLSITIVCKDRRKISDRDNTVSCLKAAIDCLQVGYELDRADIIRNDRNLRIGSVEWRITKEEPQMIIFEVEEVANENE